MKDRLDKIKDRFETSYKDYDNLIPKLVPGYADELLSVVRAVDSLGLKDTNILDLGCGTGKIGEELLSTNPGFHYYGVDLSEVMIGNANERLERFGDRTNFIVSDLSKASQIELPKIGLIISILAIHHFEDKLPVYKMISDLAIKNQSAFILSDLVVDPRKDNGVFVFRKEHMRKSGMSEESINEWFENWDEEDKPATVDENLELLAKAGFKPRLFWKNESYATFICNH